MDTTSSAGSQMKMDEFEAALGEDAFTKNMPPGLTFEEIIKNKTAPPCSLSDFMDYLVYVEHSAEDLQFFLWYYNYVQRWSQLLPRQKLLAPVWEPSKIPENRSRFVTYSHKRARSDKMTKIISIMEMDSDKKLEEEIICEKDIRTSCSSPINFDFGRPETPPVDPASALEPPKPDWFTVQPFRSEVCGVVKHYLREGTPRQLNLSPADREACLRAAPRTTHPSALLPAFLAVEDKLRNKLYPNFIRWTRSNANPTSMYMLRVVGATLFLIGCGLDAVFILSRQSNFLRILCLLFWWPGLTIFLAAWKKLCLLLHLRDVRELRPWEMFPDDEAAPAGGRGAAPSHSRKQGSSASSHDADPLRKPSLRTFGPKNDYTQERWAVLYRAKPLHKKILDDTTPVQNPGLRVLQDRTIFKCVLWGGLVAALLTVGSLFVPSMGIIM